MEVLLAACPAVIDKRVDDAGLCIHRWTAYHFVRPASPLCTPPPTLRHGLPHAQRRAVCARASPSLSVGSTSQAHRARSQAVDSGRVNTVAALVNAGCDVRPPDDLVARQRLWPVSRPIPPLSSRPVLLPCVLPLCPPVASRALPIAAHAPVTRRPASAAPSVCSFCPAQHAHGFVLYLRLPGGRNELGQAFCWPRRNRWVITAHAANADCP